MISVAEAQRLVLEQATALAPVRITLTDALGHVLAEAVASDIDSPPWDKSIVDGFAVVAEDLNGGEARLEIVEEIMAGGVPTRQISRGQATRIMTGAPIPEGSDAVVMVEQTEVVAGGASRLGSVLVRGVTLEPGRNILRRASAMRRGDEVLRAGAMVRPAEIGLLAEVGRHEVLVHPRPQVAVLATGNELVAHDRVPSAAQIRNSNGPMLCALVSRARSVPRDLGIAADTVESLTRLVRAGLEADVLVLSGGVSAGVLDLVPGVLAACSVQEVFHKVNVKPGKPLWFGVFEEGARRRLIFGLPGNPVSSLVCFELFVRPALRKLCGQAEVLPSRRSAALVRRHIVRGVRDTYVPAVVSETDEGRTVEPVVWRGSADLRALAEANSLVYFPGGDRTFEPGEILATLAL